MKNFRLITATLAVFLALGPGAEGEVLFKNYADKTFGFSVDYPAIFDEMDEPYVDGDGLSTFGGYSTGEIGGRTGDGIYAFEVSGGKKSPGVDGDSLFKEATDLDEDEFGYVNGVEPLPGTGKSDAGFYTLDYADDSAGFDEITHVYCVVNQDQMVKYWIRYPKEEAEKFAPLTARMDESLKLKAEAKK